MRKALRMIGLAVGGLALAGVAAVGTWVYVVNNVEQPKYAIVKSDGAIEVRDYSELVVAEVTRQGGRWQAVNSGFSPLAGYIFAKDRSGGKISMTAPVTQSPGATSDLSSNEKISMTAPVTQTKLDDASNTWSIRFIMPSKYTLETLPRPKGTDVRLDTVPAQRRAAIRFSGVATDELIASEEQKLRDWMAANDLQPHGQPTYAYYNDPFTPGPLRRNEVMFDVKNIETEAGAGETS